MGKHTIVINYYTSNVKYNKIYDAYETQVISSDDISMELCISENRIKFNQEILEQLAPDLITTSPRTKKKYCKIVKIALFMSDLLEETEGLKDLRQPDEDELETLDTCIDSIILDGVRIFNINDFDIIYNLENINTYLYPRRKKPIYKKINS